MKKEEICVKITDKNRNKVKEILEMFGDELYSDKTLEWNYISFSNFSTNWSGVNDPLDFELIKPKQLKEMLAKEHLKVGDVVVAKSGTTVEIESKEDNYFYSSNKDYICCYDFFSRYATEEEKELLEPKDKFAELKEAYNNGAVIECLYIDDGWYEVDYPQWDYECEYRIKPKQPLLKSEDGFDLFVGDNYHIVYFSKQQNEWCIGDYFNLDNNDFVIRYKEILKAFKHKESALKWIEKQNKPESNYEFRISVAGEDLGSWSPAELTDEITNFKLLLREKGYKATLKIEKL